MRIYANVEKMIASAYEVGLKFTNDLEVIALHGGPSKDGTFKKILEMKEKFPQLKIVDKRDNTEGYAVIKYGFAACSKEFVFYTDGDAQYRLEDDFPKLVNKYKETGADVVNGYKKDRRYGFLRDFLSKSYAVLARFFFQLPIRDVDCDFRLIRKSVMDKIVLESGNASILPEMIKKLELAGARFAEVYVNHYEREYGKSSYTAFTLLKEKLIGDVKLFFKMRKLLKTYPKK